MGLLLNAAGVFTTSADAVLGAAAGYALLWLPNAAYRLCGDGRRGFGGGDLKLSAAIGAWFGVQALLVALTIAFMAGTCAVLPGLLRGRRGLTQAVPFGPALVLGGAVLLAAGPATLVRAFGFG